MKFSAKSMRAMVATTLLAATLTTPALGFQTTTTTTTTTTTHRTLSLSSPSPSPFSSSPSVAIRSNPTAGASRQLFAQQQQQQQPPPAIATNDEVKDPGTLVSAMDDADQRKSFFAISGGVLAGSVAFIQLYDFLEGILPSPFFDPFYSVLPCVLSGAFVAAGIAHFALEDTFTAFVPPRGSWGGLWNVPAPGSEALGLTYEQYHSFWSGIAEVVVGTWLLVATLKPELLPEVGAGYGWGPGAIPAVLMYCLTVAVTPANIYMYTHNPVVPRIPALPYPWGHGGRGLLQCALLAVFYKLAAHSMTVVA